MGKVSGKTHTKEQLDHWANLHNPNNKAYRADADNRANQMKPNHRSHQRTHNANAETKRIGCPSGRLTIRNTMIKLEVHGMSKYIFDYDDGDFAMSISDSMAMDSDGDLMMRMGDHMAMDMDTGDIHMISSWSDDDEE